MAIATMTEYYRNVKDVLGIESYLLSQERDIVHRDNGITSIQDGLWQGDKVSLYIVLDKHQRLVRKAIYRNHVELIHLEYDAKGNPSVVA